MSFLVEKSRAIPGLRGSTNKKEDSEGLGASVARLLILKGPPGCGKARASGEPLGGPEPGGTLGGGGFWGGAKGRGSWTYHPGGFFFGGVKSPGSKSCVLHFWGFTFPPLKPCLG